MAHPINKAHPIGEEPPASPHSTGVQSSPSQSGTPQSSPSPQSSPGKSGTRDRPPRQAGRVKGSAKGSSAVADAQKARDTKKIGESVGEVLQIPGAIFELRGDDFCANHFETNGPKLGLAIAEFSESFPVLRKWLQRAEGGSALAGLIGAVVLYVQPCMAHHGQAPRLMILESMLGATQPDSVVTPPIRPLDSFEEIEAIEDTDQENVKRVKYQGQDAIALLTPRGWEIRGFENEGQAEAA